MNELHFHLHISPERYLRYYRGTAHTVSVVTLEGKRIEFPAKYLRPFVTHNGIQGLFTLQCDKQNRFIALHRLPEPAQ